MPISHVHGYLRHIMDECAPDRSGAVADYIPELAAVDADGYALSMCMHDGNTYSLGDVGVEFTIQSVSKPLTYALALTRLDVAEVDAKIGVEPSGEAFNEISVDERRRPRNPMINAGAILRRRCCCRRSGRCRPVPWTRRSTNSSSSTPVAPGDI